MKTILKTALIAALLTASAGMSANAAGVGIGFDIGNVSLGFSDGYWDNSHHWHRWAHRADMERYRSAHADNYHEWRHDDKHHH